LKKYESVFILEIRKMDDDGKAFAEEFGKYVESLGGVMEEPKFLGRKQFAREIKKRKAGIYWHFVFSCSPVGANGIKDKYRLDERVLRLMITTYERPEKISNKEIMA